MYQCLSQMAAEGGKRMAQRRRRMLQAREVATRAFCTTTTASTSGRRGAESMKACSLRVVVHVAGGQRPGRAAEREQRARARARGGRCRMQSPDARAAHGGSCPYLWVGGILPLKRVKPWGVQSANARRRRCHGRRAAAAAAAETV